MPTATLLGALLAAPLAAAAPHQTLPEIAGPDRVLAEVISELHAEVGQAIPVGIAGELGFGLAQDIRRRLPEGTAVFLPAWDELGARAAVGAAVDRGARCGAVIRRVAIGWEYDTVGECPDTYERPDEAYMSSLQARAAEAGREPLRSVWLSATSHASLRAGEACLSREVENPEPPPVAVTREACWLGPVGAAPLAWGVELAWGKRDVDRRIARDVRLELGQYAESHIPILSPSLGVRAWNSGQWLYAGARLKTWYVEPGAAVSVGATLGRRSPIQLEIGGEIGGVATGGPALTAAIGGVFGDR